MKYRIYICAIFAILISLCGCTDNPAAESMPPTDTVPAVAEMTIHAQNQLVSASPTTLGEWVFTNFESIYTWNMDSGETCTVSFRVPAITPVHDFAVKYNTSVSSIIQSYLDEVKTAMDTGSDVLIRSVDYEAYLFNDILSLCITYTFRDGTYNYSENIYDLVNNCPMDTVDICEKLTGLDYLNFQRIAQQLTLRNFSQTYAHLVPNIPVEYMTKEESDLHDFYEDKIFWDLCRPVYLYSYGSLYLDGEGDLKLITYVPSLGYYPYSEAAVDFSYDSFMELIRPESELYYEFLTFLPSGHRGEEETYYYRLQNVFLMDSRDFVKYAALLSDDELDRLVNNLLLFSSNYYREPEIHARCEELIQEEDLTAEEINLISEIWRLSI